MIRYSAIKEIWNALNSLGLCKSFGLEKYMIKIYKYYWDIIRAYMFITFRHNVVKGARRQGAKTPEALSTDLGARLSEARQS